MLVIKIELWPGGAARGRRDLGTIRIANNARGDAGRGDYDVDLGGFGGRGTWRRGVVRGFPRRRLGAYDLLFRALAACVGDRNAEALAVAEAELAADAAAQLELAL